MTRAALTCLLLAAPLALAACQRSVPGEGASAAESPDRLMPRRGEPRPRGLATDPERVKCSKPVDSVPCGP